jgi:RHS repeat-associated protein
MQKLVKHLPIILLLFVQISQAQVYTLSLKPDATGNDATVLNANSTGNYGNSSTLRLSRTVVGNLERSLLKFDLQAIQPGVDIISAKLIVYGINHQTANAGGGVLQLVPSLWKEDLVNWNNSETFKNSTWPSVAFAAATSAAQNYTLDVSGMVQTMVNTPNVNFGWLMYMADESTVNDKSFEFASGDNRNKSLWPKLEITYCDHLVVDAYVSPSTAENSGDAGVFLNVTKGVPPYTYVWSNAATSKDIYNLNPGLYKVTVTDSRSVGRDVYVPVTSECGTISYSLSPSPNSGFNAARLLNLANDNTSVSRNYDGSEQLKAYTSNSSGNTSLGRSLLAFDVASLPNNVQINQANLILSDNEATHTNTYKVQLCRASGSWNERTVTYYNAPGFIDDVADVKEFDYNGSQTNYNLDVTSQLQKMINEVSLTKGWLLKLKDESAGASGNAATFFGSTATGGAKPTLVLQLTSANYYCDDNLLNWEEKTTYDENGNAISVVKKYADNLGRVTQSLAKNATNEVFTQLTVYDSYSRPALVTKAAFTGNQLKFNPGFMRNQTGQMYSYNDYDTPSTLNNPTPLQNGIVNTLGNYYSNNNIYDAYQATADNPYTRTEYASTGETRRVSQPGTPFKMGSGRESYNFSMVSTKELDALFTNSSYKVSRNSTNYLECTSFTYGESIVATKQISISPDNIESITYYAGDNIIATCYNGLNTADVCSNLTNIGEHLQYAGTRSRDIHLPDPTSLVLPLPLQVPSNAASAVPQQFINYKIIDLYTDRELILNTDYSFSPVRNVIFDPSFLNQYAGKSLFLRISYNYDAAYVASLPAMYNISAPADPVITFNLTYGRFSKNYYDLYGALRKSVSPKGTNCNGVITMATTYDYNHLGRLIAEKSPDEGLKELVYDDKGKLRFSQNDEQKAGNRFNYINYDKHSRPIERGECQSSNNYGSLWFTNYYGYTAATMPPNTLPADLMCNQPDPVFAPDKSNVTTSCYTIPAAANDIPVAYSHYNQYRNFRNGQLNYVKNNNSTIWYNYDKAGRSMASITQITEADFVAKTSSLDECIKTNEINYNYFTGLTNTSTYQNNEITEKLQYQFSYDANYRPILTTLTFGNSTHNLSAYSYNKTGRLKRVVVGNNYQGLDYIYTLNGSLKAINHPGLDQSLDPGFDRGDYSGNSTQVNKDLFGEIIEYYHNDYIRSNNVMGNSINPTNSQYNGLIHTIRFKTRDVVNNTNTGANYINYGPTQTQVITNTNYQQQELAFSYTYDKFSQLATSTFGTYNNLNGNLTQRGEYAENGPNGGDISYDQNGNITSLQRKAYNINNTPVLMDDLTYQNGSTTNRLNTVIDNGSGAITAGYPNVSSNFVYNSIGQMVQSSTENIGNIDYMPGGKVKKIYFSNGNTTEYEYGADGQKLKSKFYHAGINKTKYTWYVGPYIYEFDEAGTNLFELKEAKVQGGAIRINSGVDVGNGYLVYYVTDHLGNIRVTYMAKSGTNTSGNGIDVLSYSDYYSYGGQLPGRIWAQEDCRYAYQGQEKKDAGNPWSQFELRMYSTDLGRWFAPDPKGQFYSPYLAMANNPVSYIDPDGAWVQLIVGAAIGGVFNLAVNIARGNVPLTWQGLAKGAGYFAVGAAAGAVATLGPAGWVAAGMILGGGNTALGGGSGEEIFINTVVGGITGLAGGAIGAGVGCVVGNLATQAIASNITNQIASGILIGAASGAAAGYASGFALGYATTGSLNAANKAGLQGAVIGAAVGAAAGGLNAYAALKQSRVEPAKQQQQKKEVEDGIEWKNVKVNTNKDNRVNGEISATDKQVLDAYNEVAKSYNQPELKVLPNEGTGYNGTLENGVRYDVRLYYGGNSNPNGWNLKVETTSPPALPNGRSLYLRMKN